MNVRRNPLWDSQPFGEVPDAEIARRLGVSRQRAHQQRTARGLPKAPRSTWRAQNKPPLDLTAVEHLMGNQPDRQIAQLVGCAPSTVGCWRRAHGIRASQIRANYSDVPLGQAPDSLIAHLLGVHVLTVGAHRRAHGIPSWTARGKPPYNPLAIAQTIR